MLRAKRDADFVLMTETRADWIAKAGEFHVTLHYYDDQGCHWLLSQSSSSSLSADQATGLVWLPIALRVGQWRTDVDLAAMERIRQRGFSHLEKIDLTLAEAIDKYVLFKPLASG